MAERLPHATLAVFEGSSHFPYEEEPEAFREAISTFVRGLDAPSTPTPRPEEPA
jgi:pimeloyl-ACP methyl ester carboxylesterase